jgi:hypothetical protein
MPRRGQVIQCGSRAAVIGADMVLANDRSWKRVAERAALPIRVQLLGA